MADHDVRLVQERRSHRQARIEAEPAEPHRQRGAAAAFRHLVRVHQLAAGDQLGDDHRDRLQGLDLVLGVLPPRPVLHDEDPEHALAAQHRHAHQRMVDLLAGFGAIGEIGVGLRIGQRQRARGGRDPPDETLADPQPGAMHRLGAQPLGREQFEHLAGPHHIGRADLGDHFGGDDADDLVEPFLGRARAGHDAAQAAQQPAGRRDRLGRRRAAPAASGGLGGALLDDLAHSETAPAEQSAAGDAGPACAAGRLARGDHRQRLIDKLGEDVGGALLARHHADALPGHQRAALDIAVDHRAAQRPGPEMLDLELRVLLRQLAAIEAVDDRALRLAETARSPRSPARAPG